MTKKIYSLMVKDGSSDVWLTIPFADEDKRELTAVEFAQQLALALREAGPMRHVQSGVEEWKTMPPRPIAFTAHFQRCKP